MTENTYEYECMRAELLGLEKPSLDEFLNKQKENEIQQIQDDEVDIENLKEIEGGNEDLRNVSGGLHELSNILSVTQRKLNRFKASCGSLTNLLKIKIGSGSSDESIATSSTAQESNVDNTNSLIASQNDNNVDSGNQKKTDLSKALDNNLDKLDSLIAKSDECYYGMTEQNKQMKKFLR